MIKAMKFVGIPVRNQDRALGFYRGVVLFSPEGQEDRIGTFQSIGSK